MEAISVVIIHLKVETFWCSRIICPKECILILFVIKIIWCTLLCLSSPLKPVLQRSELISCLKGLSFSDWLRLGTVTESLY